MSLPVSILAGGLGSRLGRLTEDTPKVLLEVAGKPFAVHQIELLRNHGLTELVFCVGHLGELVEAALGDGSRWGVDIRYVFDGPALLGTGGAVRRALPFLGEAFFVIYGDAYLPCNYAAVEKAFWKEERPGLMTVFHNADRWDRSNVIFRAGRIECYDKNNWNSEMRYIDYGLGVFHKRALEAFPPDTPMDLEVIYQDLLTQDQLSAFEVKERFYEIGSPAGLEEARRYLAGKEAANSGLHT